MSGLNPDFLTPCPRPNTREIAADCRYCLRRIAAIQEKYRSQLDSDLYDSLNRAMDILDRAAYIADRTTANGN